MIYSIFDDGDNNPTKGGRRGGGIFLTYIASRNIPASRDPIPRYIFPNTVNSRDSISIRSGPEGGMLIAR